MCQSISKSVGDFYYLLSLTKSRDVVDGQMDGANNLDGGRRNWR